VTTLGDAAPVELIPPGEAGRVLAGCLGGGAVVALGTLCAAAAAWVPAVVFVTAGVVVMVRSFGLHCWTEGDELVIRGLVRSRRLSRTAIERFEVIDVHVWTLGAPVRTVVAVRPDGSVQRLQATGAFIREPGSPWGDADDQVARLDAWLHPRP